MIEKIKAHIGLGRFFALPIVICSVLLGVAMGGTWSWLTVMVVLAAIFEMAYSHSFNTLLDYCWTGFDKGEEEERSRGKIYTQGQQAIASGQLTTREVLINGLVYLAISAIFTGIVSVNTTPIIWAIWGASALCTFWYSWGKLHYQCELALGVGFGPLAVMLGMASQPNPDYLSAFLASIPFLLIWGYAAETIDQYIDAEPNWSRGLRNFGALLWRYEVSASTFITWILCITFAAQFVLIASGILVPQTALSLITFIPFSFCILYLDNHLRAGVMWGLGGIFLYMALVVIGQVIGG
jgi:hypothetical protein